MASTRGIRAGRAFVELFADDSKLVRGLRRAEKKLKAFGDSVRTIGLKLAGLGAAMAAPLAAATKTFASMGDKIAKMAKRTGLSVEALSALQFAAGRTGTSLEALETGIRRMQRSIYDAGRGLSTQTDALRDLGLRYADLAGLAPEEQFQLLADAIRKVEDPTRRAALAQAFFGRAGTQLIPLMAGGAKGIEALTAEAKRLGLIMSGEDAAAAEELTDTLGDLWGVVKMGVFQVGAALAPAIRALAEDITAVAKTARDFIESNRRVVVGVAQIAVGLLTAGAAAVVFGQSLKLVGSVVGMVAKVIALATSPVGLLIGVLVGLGAALVAVFAKGQTMAEKFASVLDGLREVVTGMVSRVVFVWNHFGEVLRYVLVEGAYQIVRFFKIVKHWIGQIPTVVKWVVDNWRDLFTTAWNFVKTFCTNVAVNLKNLMDAIWSFMKGEGFQFEWTGLLDGFESTLKEMPQIAARQLGATEKQLRKLRDEVSDGLNRSFEEHDRTFRQKLKEFQLPGFSDLLDAMGIPDITAPQIDTSEADAVARRMQDLLGMDVGGQLADQAAKIGSQGTFVASNVLGLQAGGAADRMANGIDKIERNTRPLRDAEGVNFT